MPSGIDDDVPPAPRWAGEQANLEAEARRLAMMVRTAEQKRETLERQMRARLAGYVPVDEWLADAEARAEREAEARAEHMNGSANGRGANGTGLRGPYRDPYRGAREAWTRSAEQASREARERAAETNSKRWGKRGTA